MPRRQPQPTTDSAALYIHQTPPGATLHVHLLTHKCIDPPVDQELLCTKVLHCKRASPPLLLVRIALLINQQVVLGS